MSLWWWRCRLTWPAGPTGYGVAASTCRCAPARRGRALGPPCLDEYLWWNCRNVPGRNQTSWSRRHYLTGWWWLLVVTWLVGWGCGGSRVVGYSCCGGGWGVMLLSVAGVGVRGWQSKLIETCWGKVMLTASGLDVAGRAGRDVRLAVMRGYRASGRLPYFRVIESSAGSRSVVEGREKLMFAANNYLGLCGDRRLIEASNEATSRYGPSCASTPPFCGTFAIKAELEALLADWYGTEDALVFNSGYQANVGAHHRAVGGRRYRLPRQ